LFFFIPEAIEEHLTPLTASKSLLICNIEELVMKLFYLIQISAILF